MLFKWFWLCLIATLPSNILAFLTIIDSSNISNKEIYLLVSGLIFTGFIVSCRSIYHFIDNHYSQDLSLCWIQAMIAK